MFKYLQDVDAYIEHHNPRDSEAHSITDSNLGPEVPKSPRIFFPTCTRYKTFGIFRSHRLCALPQALQHSSLMMHRGQAVYRALLQ